MALDEALLRADPVQLTLRTYRWDPWSLSLGYFQEVRREEVERLLADGHGLVRRPTGGGAIFHGPELTYAVVWPTGFPGLPRDAEGAYDVVHGALARALGGLGVATAPRNDAPLESDTGREGEFWCFYHSVAFDLVLDGRKLVGSAQRRTRRGFLMHGSIPLRQNPLTPEAAWADTGPEEVSGAVARELALALDAAPEPGRPTAEEEAIADRLARRRYAEPGWTYRR
jgi:lipoate-protein ligase A